MAKQRKYNTAVIATDKNGNKFKYKSLEEASKKLDYQLEQLNLEL